MKKLVKKILGAIVIASIMFSVMPGINVSAITGYHSSSKISPCPYCKVKNISYGVMWDFKGTSQTFHEGEYCKVCKRTVPSGESHYCYTVQDRFSFTFFFFAIFRHADGRNGPCRNPERTDTDVFSGTSGFRLSGFR